MPKSVTVLILSIPALRAIVNGISSNASANFLMTICFFPLNRYDFCMIKYEMIASIEPPPATIFGNTTKFFKTDKQSRTVR